MTRQTYLYAIVAFTIAMLSLMFDRPSLGAELKPAVYTLEIPSCSTS